MTIRIVLFFDPPTHRGGARALEQPACDEERIGADERRRHERRLSPSLGGGGSLGESGYI